MKTNSVPKIRFKGFTDDWEQRKLGEIAEFNPKSDLPDEFEYVDLESVVGTEMVFHRTENKASAPSRAQRVAKTGDVFFQTVRPYQRNNYLFSMPYENYVFSTGYAQMRPKINAAFLMCFLQTESFVQNVLDNCTGTSYPAINSSDLSNLKISLPILKSEQSKIGKLISNLDHLITLHQRKCEQTKELKKFMLQKMFPKKGEKNPEIRFPGFTDDWEQRKLGELVTFSKGSGYSKGDLLKEGTPIILYGRLYTKYETVISNVDTFVEPKGKSVFSKGGEVIVPGSGETAEDISIASVVEESGVLLGGDLNIITPPKEINSAFLAISISNGKPHKDMAKMAQGKSVVHLHNSDLAKIDFPFPIYEEQCRISNQFAELDNLITLHQRKCEQLKELKKFMLQNMFPKKG